MNAALRERSHVIEMTFKGYGKCHGSIEIPTAAHANWTVLYNTMGSDHCPTVVILYNKETFVEEAGTPQFKLSKADWRHFKRNCNDTVTVESTSADTIDWHND